MHPIYPVFARRTRAEGYTIRTHVLYLRRFLDALGYPRVALVGNSLGGWIAAMFAAEYPERVEHLYLLDSAGLQGSMDIRRMQLTAQRRSVRWSMSQVARFQ